MAKQQPRPHRKNNRSIDELGHRYRIANNRGVVLTDPDRAVVADSNGFLPVAGLRTFVAAHKLFLPILRFYKFVELFRKLGGGSR
jgi:hypothetical protein